MEELCQGVTIGEVRLPKPEDMHRLRVQGAEVFWRRVLLYDECFGMGIDLVLVRILFGRSLKSLSWILNDLIS
jgi:hypothetical protein